jgi:predicted flap endonuclease-1-like 5' DNA nuclease
MSYKIDEIEGIGPAYREKLAAAGVSTTEDLLSACCTKPGRAAMAEGTGIGEKLLLTWSNMADLMRISGVGKQFAELLHAAGVDTVKELKTRRADNLFAKMAQINAEKNLAKTSPAESLVAEWVKVAGELEALISH